MHSKLLYEQSELFGTVQRMNKESIMVSVSVDLERLLSIPRQVIYKGRKRLDYQNDLLRPEVFILTLILSARS